MDIALTLLALIQGGALVHFYHKSATNKATIERISTKLEELEHLISAIGKSEPNERLTLLEQKVTALQMRR